MKDPSSLPSLVLVSLLAALIAALVTSLLVPLVRRLAVVLEAIDHPGDRKLHAEPVPRLGGVAMVAGLVFGSGAILLTMRRAWAPDTSTEALVALTLGTGLVFLAGFVDDLVGLSAWKKLLVQIAAACIVVAAGWRFDVLGIPGSEIPLGVFGTVLAVVWIVGVTNAINLIDGLDGLASGVVAIIAVSFLAYSLAYLNPFAAVMAAAMLGCCLGFLPHNWEPARIFMGDAGSLTLGFLLASLSVYSTLKSPAAVAILVPILALGVPVIDTLMVMLVRFVERPKGHFSERFLRVLHADRNHLHHLLESLVASRRAIVRRIYVMVAVSCVMALAVALTRRSSLGFVLLAVELGAVVLVRKLGLARKARSLSRRQRQTLEKELLSPAEVQRHAGEDGAENLPLGEEV